MGFGSVGIKSLSELLIDASKDWQGKNITNLGAGAHDVNAKLSSIVTAFLGLSDTPGSYAGQGGKLVAVKDDVSALEFITSPYYGFGNHWQWLASPSVPFSSVGHFYYDLVSVGVNATGQDYRLYTNEILPYSLNNHQSLQFKAGRTTPLAGTPLIVWGITTGEKDVIGNQQTEGMWFMISNSNIYGFNGNGTNSTYTLLGASDLITPLWFRIERQETQIQFILNNTVYATHTTNLPDATKNCIFVFQIKGVDNFSRAFAITHPEFGRI